MVKHLNTEKKKRSKMFPLPFGKADPKKMQEMLKQLGVKSKEISAEEVIIKSGEKKIVIREPQVTEIEFSGQKSFQIVGNVSVEEAGKERSEISKKDIKFVSEMLSVPEDKAKEALEKANGDIAKAILLLKSKKK